MALVAFMRGINVGGHRNFRPSLLAQQLKRYDVVSVGTAGTFVVRKPGSQAKFRAALLRKMPFRAEVMLCHGRDILRLLAQDPFRSEQARPDTVRFVSISAKTLRPPPLLPGAFPAQGQWFVRILSSQGQFVFGLYRRHMKTIGYLGQLDRLFGGQLTTRNWNTICAIGRILRESG